MNNDKCRICHSKVAHYCQMEEYSYFRCTSCGHVFLAPIPSDEELERFYNDARFYMRADSQSQRQLKEAKIRLGKLSDYCDRYHVDRRLLDVGCANGRFLSVAADAGWCVEGVERSLKLATEAIVSNSAPVIHQQILEERQIATGPFPVITAWEVIEHSPDPFNFLQAISRELSPNGLLFLSTPMMDGLPAMVMAGRFPMISPPEHINLFTRKSLLVLATQLGLERVGFSSFSNIGANELASGLARIFSNKQLDGLPNLVKRCFLISGRLLSFIPSLVDQIGLGSEMEVVFRKKP